MESLSEEIRNVSGGLSKGLRHRAENVISKGEAGKRLLVSSKVWCNTIPTTDCDVMLTFPLQANENQVMWLLSRIRGMTPGIKVNIKHHQHSRVYGFYMKADCDTLLKGADDLHLPKPLKTEFGGGHKEFVYDDRDLFEGYHDPDVFFSSQERQMIIQHILNTSLRSTGSEVVGKIELYEGQAIIPTLESKGIVCLLPLHSLDDLKELKSTWIHSFGAQPLEKITNYFGVKIGLYFAYLGHYTMALVLPSFIGLIVWQCSGKSQLQDDVCFILFSIVNVLWATVYLALWKRQSASLAYQWGTLDKTNELLVESRPLFKGDYQRSLVTGKMEPYYATWKRLAFTYFVSVPAICLCLCVVFCTMLCIFELQEAVNKFIKKGYLINASRFLPQVLLALCISILDIIYKRIAVWLNNKENYREQENYENNLIFKLVLFQFVNSFLSLFYVAFYLQDFKRLQEQLATIFITRQIIGNIKEVLVPYMYGKLSLLKIGFNMTQEMSPDTLQRQFSQIVHDSNQNGQQESVDREDKSDDKDNKPSTPQLTQAEVESSMKKYEDTYEDYLEMFIQFGYVMLFSPAFPLAALCALINNIVEIRSDAFKLCVGFQRPFAQRVPNIGLWQNALEAMVCIAILVNLAMMVIPLQRCLPSWSLIYIVAAIIVLEHILVLQKMLLSYAISDVPHWVAQAKAKLEYMRRQALKKLESQLSSDGKVHGTGGLKTSVAVAPHEPMSDPDMTESHPKFISEISYEMACTLDIGVNVNGSCDQDDVKVMSCDKDVVKVTEL